MPLLNVDDAINFVEKLVDEIEEDCNIAVQAAGEQLKSKVLHNIDTQTFAAGGEIYAGGPKVPQDTFFLGGPAPNVVVTQRPLWVPRKRTKEKHKLLIDTGRLINAIEKLDTSIKEQPQARVGVFGDSEVVDIATSMEMGTYMGNLLVGGGEHRGIPPRSFLLNTINAETKNLQHMIKSILIGLLGEYL